MPRNWESWKAKCLALCERHGKYLPWVSLVWGTASGFFISRDYSSSTRLLIASLCLVVATAFVSLWFSWQKNSEILGEARVDERPLVAAVRRRAALIEWLALAATQIYAQYIFLFSAPLLFLGKAWLSFTCTALFAGVTLWDPWWNTLARRHWFRLSVRCWGSMLAASFLFPLLFPEHVHLFYPVIWAVGIGSLVPWPLFIGMARHIRQDGLFPFVPSTVLMGVLACQLSFDVWLEFPPLSIWLKGPALGLEIQDREIVTPFGEEVDANFLQISLQRGRKICCLTPIVAPRYLTTPVSHEWFLDGVRIDRILLPPVLGKDDRGSYRTYSCKSHLALTPNARQLTCKTYLEPGIHVGTVHATLANF